MKTELETVEVGKVKLDIHFTYNKYFGFEIYSIEDIVGTQDLSLIISDYYLMKIDESLRGLYQQRGWL